MRVLMLVPQCFYSTRGTPLSAYHRTKELLELGHEVDILTYGLGDPAPDLDATILRARGPHFARSIKQGPSALKIWFDALFFANLIACLTRKRYDLMYGHEEGAFMAALLGPIFRVPYVYDMHSSLPLQISEWNFSRSKAVIGFFRWVERFTVGRARAVVAISPGVAQAARAAVPGVGVVTIVNRFALERVLDAEGPGRVREELGVAPGQPLVLYTGSFVALQALELLVDAAPRVIARVPDVRIVLVGGREPEMSRLGDRVRQLGVEDNVKLVAARPQEQMPAFMAAADVLVSPRIVGINPPGKLFSYLDSERPVVATDRPVHNQILNRDCAILTEPTAEAFAEGILTALLDREAAAHICSGARRILETEYGPGARAEAYTRLMELVRVGG